MRGRREMPNSLQIAAMLWFEHRNLIAIDASVSSLWR
jgi:hypothetical protein